MHFSTRHDPVFAVLDIELDEGETILAQPGTMLSMTTGITLSASGGGVGRRRGLFGGLLSLFAGESFFRASFKAKRDGQRVLLAPDHIGAIVPLETGEGAGFYIARGAWLASTEGVAIKVVYGGAKGWLTKTGLFFLHATGEGHLFCSAHGGVERRVLGEGETFILDNRFVIALSDTVKYELVKATAELSTAVMSGEGLVNRYTGPGVVYYQTRSPRGGFSLAGMILEAIF